METCVGPAVERYTQAVDTHRTALQERDNHRVVRQLEQLDRSQPNMAVAAMNVRALEVWAGWATGAPVTDHQLRLTRQALTYMRSTPKTRHLITQLDTDPALTNPPPHQTHGVDRDVGRYWDHDLELGRSDGMDLGR